MKLINFYKFKGTLTISKEQEVKNVFPNMCGFPVTKETNLNILISKK